jgi:hypothetical protein
MGLSRSTTAEKAMTTRVVCWLLAACCAAICPRGLSAEDAPVVALERITDTPRRAERHTPIDAEFWKQLAPRPRDLWGETKETFWGWNLGYVAATAGLAGGLAFLDNDMQKPWRRGDQLLGNDLCNIGDVVGNPGVQAGVMGLTYTLGQLIGDQKLTQTGKSMAETMIFTSLTTLALKGAFHRERPDDSDHLSFPSWHASATFGNATVLAEYYGWKAAVPAYLISIFVAWTRIEDNKHFVTDTITGAAIGCIYGHAVSRYNMRTHSNISVEPVLTNDGPGVQASVRF